MRRTDYEDEPASDVLLEEDVDPDVHEEVQSGLSVLKAGPSQWGLDWKSQPAVSTLQVRDYIYWKHKYASGLLLLAHNLLVYILTLYDFTLLSLVCTVSWMFIAGFLIYCALCRLLKWEKPEVNFQIDMETATELLEEFLIAYNRLATKFTEIVSCENWGQTIGAFVVLYILSHILGWFSGMFIAHMAVNALLTLPAICRLFQVEIRERLDQVNDLVDNKVMSKVRPILNPILAKIGLAEAVLEVLDKTKKDE